jgi:integrase/recombinase XerD
MENIIEGVVFLLLKFACKDFLNDRELKNVSHTTMDRYKRVTDEFQLFCASQEIINVEDITANNIKRYLLYCQNERGNNPTTLTPFKVI